MTNEEMDAEVIALVRANPTRKVDLDSVFCSRRRRSSKAEIIRLLTVPVLFVLNVIALLVGAFIRSGWNGVTVSVFLMVICVVVMGLIH